MIEDKKEKMESKQEFKDFIKECVEKDGALLPKEEEGKPLFGVAHLGVVKAFLNHIKKQMDEANAEARKNDSKNAKTYGIGDIFDGTVFGTPLAKNYAGDKDVIIRILLHCNWLMYLCSDRQHKQEGAAQHYAGDCNDYFNVPIEWAIGATFSGTSLDAMMFIVCMLIDAKNDLKADPSKKAIETIETICKSTKYFWEEDNNKKEVSSDAIRNILLFLCNSEYYLPIPAQNKKELIASKLGEALEITNENGTNEKDTNEKLLYSSFASS